MKIGLVTEYYPPFAPGGAEWSIYYLAQRLAAHPDVERLVVITPNYGAAAYEEEAGVQVERYPFPLKLGGRRRLLDHTLLANPLFYAYSAVQIIQAIRKYRLDLIHAQNKQVIPGAVWAARLCGLPVVASLRDVSVLCRYGMCLLDYNTHPQGCDLATYITCLRRYMPLYMQGLTPRRRAFAYAMAIYHRLDSQLKQAMLSRADAVVTISDRLGEIIRSRGVNPAQMVTIYNPMPESITETKQSAPTSAAPQPKPWQLFFAGRLTWGKGAPVLIEALPKVVAALAPSPVRLAIAGDGPLRRYLEARLVDLGLRDQVDFLDSVPQAQMAQHYATADLVVVPSVVQEGFGRVALEALAAGTPVVASTHGGLGEIVQDGITGFVVEPEREPLAEAIVRVIQDAGAFRQRVAAAQPALRAKFGDNLSDRHLALYTSLVNNRAAHHASS